MPKRLENLIEAANATFSGDRVQQQFKEPTHEGLKPREVLASYIVSKIKDLYDAGSSDEQNLNRIITGLEDGVHDLDGVIQHLKALKHKNKGELS